MASAYVAKLGASSSAIERLSSAAAALVRSILRTSSAAISCSCAYVEARCCCSWRKTGSGAGAAEPGSAASTGAGSGETGEPPRAALAAGAAGAGGRRGGASGGRVQARGRSRCARALLVSGAKRFREFYHDPDAPGRLARTAGFAVWDGKARRPANRAAGLGGRCVPLMAGRGVAGGTRQGCGCLQAPRATPRGAMRR